MLFLSSRQKREERRLSAGRLAPSGGLSLISVPAGCRRVSAEGMHRWSKLNERQLHLLRKAAVDPEAVAERRAELAQTVYALRDRGLVEVGQAGQMWSVQVTEAGLFYLDHGHHPELPVSGQPPHPTWSDGRPGWRPTQAIQDALTRRERIPRPGQRWLQLVSGHCATR